MTTRMTPDPQVPGSEQGPPRHPAPRRLEQLENSLGRLWQSALLLLFLLAVTLAALSWQGLRSAAGRFEALPIGLVILVLLFGLYVWRKSQELSELRGLVRGIEHRESAPPSTEQLEQLFTLVARSQQGYRDLIDTFDDHLLALSLEGEIRAANRSFASLLGRPFPQIIGHGLDEFLDDPQGALRAAARNALPHFLARRHWAGVLRVRVKPGVAGAEIGVSPVRYFDCVFHAILKDGQVSGVSVLARDVTQQRESEARFTELFETLQEGVYFTTPEGKLLEANPGLVHMLGYGSKEELLGVRVADLYMDAAQRDAEIDELERQGVLYAREIILRRKDGSAVVCLDNCTAIRDAFGKVIRYQGTLQDITHRREMERRLHTEQEFARRLVDSFPDLIVALDTQGRYTWLSPRIKELLGYAPEELLGKSLGERSHPEDQPGLLEVYNDLLLGRQTYANVEYRTQHKSGEWRVFRATASPLYDADGKIAGVIASSRDVTEVKRLEQQLIQSEKLAAVGQMIAGVAHELNNPLTAILGVTELLREGATDDTARRQVDLAHRQARRASTIVQNLLAFSRPPAPRKTNISPADLIQRTLQLHEYSLRQNGITVDFAPNPAAPRAIGDANQLMQVFLNLITNAEQAIREVRDHGTLRVRVEADGDRVRIHFQDDGPGIRPEILPNLFDPFFTTKRPGRGTGLGLSICMAIVREHGGEIHADSPPEGGAVFTVSLPRGAQPDAASAASPIDTQTLPRIEPCPGLEQRVVLVVDDEEGIRELVQDGLAAAGLRADCAATAEEALALASRCSYDAVLCDLNLGRPGSEAVSGKDLLGQISRSQRSDPGPLLIFMTGDLVEGSLLESLQETGNHVIQKPFRISELVNLLRAHMETLALPEPSSPRRRPS
jgi:PAS domain S-box-containing protein